MPKNCAVIGCFSKATMRDRRFYRFPMLNKTCARNMALSQTRQGAWLTALNRADFFPKSYQHARVCDLHFVSGRSASLKEIENVDWIPTLNLGYKIKIEPASGPVDRLVSETNERITQKEVEIKIEPASGPVDRLVSETNERITQKEVEPIEFVSCGQPRTEQCTQTPFIQKFSVGTQTEGIDNGIGFDGKQVPVNDAVRASR